jgi:hypothetical protein
MLLASNWYVNKLIKRGERHAGTTQEMPSKKKEQGKVETISRKKENMKGLNAKTEKVGEKETEKAEDKQHGKVEATKTPKTNGEVQAGSDAKKAVNYFDLVDDIAGDIKF